MSLQSEIFSEVEELIGRLSAVRVNWPDTEVRVKHTIFNLRQLLAEPAPLRLHHIVDDLQDLRIYMNDILRLDEKALSHDFMPVLELITRLLGPTSGESS